jgi:ABC-type oligopeptide transport system ATPase subunit
MSLLAARFRQNVSKMKDYRMKSETEFSVGYPTGYLSYDFTNGTVIHVKTVDKDLQYYSIGITDGSMVMVIGRSGCGKTTWVMQAAGNIIRPFKSSCIWHDDIEGGITDMRKEQLVRMYGTAFKERYISRNSGITAENFYERIKMIHDLKMAERSEYEYDTGLYDTSGNRIYKLEPSVYILDSLAMLMPEKYTEEEELSGQMSSTAAAKANAMVFKRIIPILKSANIILFVINHILDDVSINPMQKKKPQFSYLKMGETLPITA